MAHPSKTNEHDGTVVDILLGAFLVFCALTLIVLIGIF